MGSILASKIIDRTLKQLMDDDEVRWDKDELLSFLNAGQQAIVILKPDANTVTQTIVASQTTNRNQIPNPGYKFLRALHYEVATVPQGVLTEADYDTLCLTNKTWLSDTGNPAHYIVDKLDPHSFWLYPRPSSAIDVAIQFSASPVNVADIGDAITLSDIYENALFYYMMFEAHSKDTTAGRTEKARAYASLFGTQIGVNLTAEELMEKKDGSRQ